MLSSPPMTPAQCKAARHLLGWSARRLAEAADVSHTTLLHFEGSKADTGRRTVKAIRGALEAAGVEFMGRGTRDQARVRTIELDDGSGVRLRKPPASSEADCSPSKSADD